MDDKKQEAYMEIRDAIKEELDTHDATHPSKSLFQFGYSAGLSKALNILMQIAFQDALKN